MTYEDVIDNAIQAGNNGDWATAISILKSAIAKVPPLGKAHHYLIAAYLRCNNWKAAVDAGRRADQIVTNTDPWKARILFAWADAEIMEGNFNKAKNMDKGKLERVSFGQYCRFTTTGIYEYFALLKDSEVTTFDGRIEAWDWESAWNSPFILIKPYNQKPYPLKINIEIHLYQAESKIWGHS